MAKNWPRRMAGGFLGVLGFLLSPLSWWNDLFVNVPIAVAFGWLISLLHQSWFEPAVVAGYWLTNILGLVLLHKGAQSAVTGQARPYTRRDLLRDLLISLLYTGVVVTLIRLGVLQPIGNYLKSGATSP